jgi:hypothetical protein
MGFDAAGGAAVGWGDDGGVGGALALCGDVAGVVFAVGDRVYSVFTGKGGGCDADESAVVF